MPDLVIHVKKPVTWAAPLYVHVWDTQPPLPATLWPGVAMIDEGDGWFGHTIVGAGSAHLIFHDGAGHQTADLRRDRDGWYDAVGRWHDQKPAAKAAAPARAKTAAGEIKLYFGIHKHMHQPYYNTTDSTYWDGEKDQIFGSRGGNYTSFVPGAVHQYAAGGLPHAGLSTSWSGSPRPGRN